MPGPDVSASTRKRTTSSGPTRSDRLVVLPLLLALACSDSPPDMGAAGEVDARAASPVVAVVDGVEIPSDAVDARLRLDLHDLEQTAYARRLERIEALARERLGPGIEPGSPEWDARVEIRLEPPEPPRLAIPPSPGPALGPATAPVTLVEFVDFESPHCRRLQPDLLRVLEDHPDEVRLEIRDLPLPYHRQAFVAAKAAHCAGEQGAYWAYHDLLLLEQPAFSPGDLARHADRLGLDPGGFSACLASARGEDRIRTDLAVAASLGVHRAPTLFVNGLYVAGRPSIDAIERLVRRELERLGLPPTSVSRSAAATESRVRSGVVVPESEAHWPHLSPEEMPEPELTLTLDRAEILRALEDRSRLDDKLEASAGRFSGERLLKLRRVDQDDLYSRLGLEPGDVLLLIDGRFVTAGGDRLWDALAESDSFTLLLMRRGRPHSFLYRIR